MNCILYARVSTDRQAEKELSIPAQLAAMRQFAKGNGWRVLEEYVDRGESARTMKRPELQKLIRFCAEKKGVGIVVVHKLDRMARNLPDYLTIKAELKKKGIRLVSMTENFEDSVTGRLLENIIASISEWYSGNLGEEVKKSALVKLQRGEWPQRPPIGYKSVRTEDKRIQHVEEPAAASLVRQAFELFATGDCSLGQLSEVMAERGVRTRHGKLLSQQAIKTILSNPFYAGTLRWNDREYKGKHAAIIAPDLFFRVQRVLKERSVDREKGVRSFLLRGIVQCGSCEQKLTAEVHPRGSYYRCPSHTYTKRCSEPYIPVKSLDNQLKVLYEDLQPSRGTMELLRDEIASIAEDRQRRTDSELESLKQKIADAEAKELALADEFVGKTVSKDMYDRLATKYQNQRKEAEARVSQLSVDYKDPLDFFDKAAVTSAALGYLHQRFRFRQRRILLRAIFRSITVQNREIVGLELNPPFSTFIGNDPRYGGSMPLGNPPIGPSQLASQAKESSLPKASKGQHNVFENPPVRRTKLAQQAIESSLPKASKRQHNVFENPPLRRTKLAEQAIESSLPTARKDQHNMFENSPVRRTKLAEQAIESSLPTARKDQHNMFENSPVRRTKLAEQAIESSLPTARKDQHNMFENSPVRRTEQDIFEQLIGFTPTEEFLALMELLKALPNLKKLYSPNLISREQ